MKTVPVAIIILLILLVSLSTCNYWKEKKDNSDMRHQIDSLRRILPPVPNDTISILPNANTRAGALAILADTAQRNKFLSALQIIFFNRDSLQATLSHFSDTTKNLFFVAYPDSITGIDPQMIVAPDFATSTCSTCCPPVCNIPK
ncbi:MAG: hypothetical protein H0W62_01965 [Chitinophagales bacterium]|nr:hypothetical protein [Chitinophagales bacterium]